MDICGTKHHDHFGTNQSLFGSIWESLSVNNTTWRYYRLGTGTPVLSLTGGMRRAALGFASMEKLSRCHTVIAPDYPPVQSIGDVISALDAILCTEDVTTFTLAGQAYGGMLSQAYLAYKSQSVDRLIRSSTGPLSAIGNLVPCAEYRHCSCANSPGKEC